MNRRCGVDVEYKHVEKGKFPRVTNVSRCGRPDGWLHYLHPLTAGRRFRSLHMFSTVIWNDIRRAFRVHEAYRLLRRVLPISSRISPIIVESIIPSVRWKSAFLCQPYPDIGGRPHLITRYDWNILTGTMDFIRNYVDRNILSVRMPLRASSHNKMLFKSDNILFDKELVFL